MPLFSMHPRKKAGLYSAFDHNGSRKVKIGEIQVSLQATITPTRASRPEHLSALKVFGELAEDSEREKQNA